MNLVLADTEEFRRVKRRQDKSGSGSVVESEEKRTLGLTIVRGAYIVSLSVESPPPADPSARLGKSAPGGIASALSAGPGVAKPAGRGAAPPSLAVSKTSFDHDISEHIANILHRALRLELVALARPQDSLASPVVLLQASLAKVAEAVSGIQTTDVDVAFLTVT